MAQLKLTPPINVVASPNFARARRRLADAPFRSRGEDDAALAKIAQRFAPGAQTAAAPLPPERHVARNPSAPLPRGGDAALGPSSGGALAAFKILPAELRRLIAALMFIAVLPSLTIAAMFFFGGARVPWLAGQASAEGEAPRAAVTAASLADLPASPAASRPAAPHRTASLAAPTALEAKAGQSVPFALALASVAPLPEPSVIAVSGLPRGATFSAGQPYGEREWNLRPDEIGGLRLLLPRDARGAAKLEIALIAADGTQLASAETAVKMSAAADEIAASGAAPVAAAVSPSVSTAPQQPSAQASSMQEPTTQASSTQEPTTQGSSAQASSTQAASIQGSSIQASAAQAPSIQASSTQEPTTQAPVASAENANAEGAKSAITLSEFVNFREGPTSSARVIGVIAKGSSVTPLERRRGWLKVTDASSGETGWIYGRYTGGAKASGAKESGTGEEASPLRLGPGSDDSFWTRVGNWLSGS